MHYILYVEKDKLLFYKERSHGTSSSIKEAAIYDEDGVKDCFRDGGLVIAIPVEENYPALCARKHITKKPWTELLKGYRNNGERP